MPWPTDRPVGGGVEPRSNVDWERLATFGLGELNDVENFDMWMIRVQACVLVLATALAVGACEPEVGSEEWCENMEEKSKGDWTANELADFAKHCVF